MGKMSRQHAIENDLPPSPVPDDVDWDGPGKPDPPRLTRPRARARKPKPVPVPATPEPAFSYERHNAGWIAVAREMGEDMHAEDMAIRGNPGAGCIVKILCNALTEAYRKIDELNRAK